MWLIALELLFHMKQSVIFNASMVKNVGNGNTMNGLKYGNMFKLVDYHPPSCTDSDDPIPFHTTLETNEEFTILNSEAGHYVSLFLSGRDQNDINVSVLK